MTEHYTNGLNESYIENLEYFAAVLVESNKQ